LHFNCAFSFLTHFFLAFRGTNFHPHQPAFRLVPPTFGHTLSFPLFFFFFVPCHGAHSKSVPPLPSFMSLNVSLITASLKDVSIRTCAAIVPFSSLSGRCDEFRSLSLTNSFGKPLFFFFHVRRFFSCSFRAFFCLLFTAVPPFFPRPGPNLFAWGFET